MNGSVEYPRTRCQREALLVSLTTTLMACAGLQPAPVTTPAAETTRAPKPPQVEEADGFTCPEWYRVDEGEESRRTVCAIPLHVVVLRAPGGRVNLSHPYVDPRASASRCPKPPDVTDDTSSASNIGPATLGTSLTEADLDEIFEQVNAMYAHTGIQWAPEYHFIEPGIAPGSNEMACDAFKCRSHDRVVEYMGQSHRGCHNAQWLPMFQALVPSGDGDFVEGGYSLLFVKWVGGTLQGVALSDGRVHVGVVGEWSTKMGSLERRPRSLAYGDRHTTVDGRVLDGGAAFGFSMAFTTAHELGHLLGLHHEYKPSIMKGKGPRFAPAHVEAIQAWVTKSERPDSSWISRIFHKGYTSVMEASRRPRKP